jgi:hypothetical protein
MYYIYRSPCSNNIVHATIFSDLYDERMLLEQFLDKQSLEDWAELKNKEICWCESDPIPHSLSTESFPDKDFNWRNVM